MAKMRMNIVHGSHEIEIYYPDNVKDLPLEERDADYLITIKNTECGRDFSFYMKNHRLKAKGSLSRAGSSGYEDWYTALTEREKIDLMQMVLADYRRDSADKDGMKTAAVGVVANPDKNAPVRDRHLIYVGFNSNDSASDYLKNCAERVVLDEARGSMRRHMIHRCGEANPPKPKFLEFHVMGGRDPNPQRPGDNGVHGVCPCGQCIDRLAQEMVKGGKMYIYPYRGHEQQHQIERDAKSFSRVRGNDIWATDIDTLNNLRYIDLSPEYKKIQQDGLEWVAERLVDYTPRPRSAEAKARNAEAYDGHEDGIPELDVAIKNGVLDVTALNDYLHDELLKTLNSRRRGQGIPADKEAILDWLNTRVRTVRVVVIKTDDGHYHLSKDSRTSRDNALPNAESSALSSAVDALGEHGVEAIYTLTLDPANISEGVVRTLSKDGLERAYKRVTKDPEKEMSVSHILLNNGGLSREKQGEIVSALTFGMDQIYPSHFAGNFAQQVKRTAGAGGLYEKNIPRSTGWAL